MPVVKTLKQTSLHRYARAAEKKAFEQRLSEVMHEWGKIRNWKDSKLRAATDVFQQAVVQGTVLEVIAAPAFAVAAEIYKRVSNKIPLEQQLLAAIVMQDGKIAEVNDSYDFLVPVSLAAYVQALTGKGVHIITQTYSESDKYSTVLHPYFKFLNVSVGCIANRASITIRRAAYHSDVTIVSIEQVIVDYLSDRHSYSRNDRVMRPGPLYCAVLPRIDIAGPQAREIFTVHTSPSNTRKEYSLCMQVAQNLTENKDFIVNYANKTVHLTEDGFLTAEHLLGKNLFTKQSPQLLSCLRDCLKAQVLYERERDYVIEHGTVVMLEEFSGKILQRKFPLGLHEALEAKENLPLPTTNRIQASSSAERFLQNYKIISGIKLGSQAASRQLFAVYGAETIQVPFKDGFTKDASLPGDLVSIYDQTVEAQLAVIYALRDELVENEPAFIEFLEQSVQNEVGDILKLGDAELAAKEFLEIFGIHLHPSDLEAVYDGSHPKLLGRVRERFTNYLVHAAHKISQPDSAYQAAQRLILHVIDDNVSLYLELLEALAADKNTLSYINPQTEFLQETQAVFDEMVKNIQKQFVKTVFWYLQGKGIIK